MGGTLRPYVGAGVGIALNTIADYVVYDKGFYPEPLDPAAADYGQITAVSDIYAYHNGGTTEQLAYMIEGGITTELDGGIKLDFFVKYSGLGQIKTSGSIVVSQSLWLGDGSHTANGEFKDENPDVKHYTNWYESGSLSTVDVGVRMRLQF
jgi:opacity protein-like surface antigen